MLIPNLKFLVLPLVALVVIASLPSTATTEHQGQPLPAATAAAPAKSVTDCEQPGKTSPACTHVAGLANNVLVR